MLTTPRGICERDWAGENPSGTRNEFNAYFKGLPRAKRGVCGLTKGNNIIKVASQEYDQKAEALVILALTVF